MAITHSSRVSKSAKSKVLKSRGSKDIVDERWIANKVLSKFFGKTVYSNALGAFRFGRTAMNRSTLLKVYEALGEMLDIEAGGRKAAH